MKRIKGGARNDVIVGSEKDERIEGLGGNDMLIGLGGDDEILGGDGNDLLDGGSGNDAIWGGNGDDIIHGGGGGDLIDGGAGTDLLVLSGVRNDYRIETLSGDRVRITDLRSGRFSEGTDLVSNVIHTTGTIGVVDDSLSEGMLTYTASHSWFDPLYPDAPAPSTSFTYTVTDRNGVEQPAGC